MTVDGTPARIGQQVDPESAAIMIDGIPLPVAPDVVYYLAYKPTGVVSTASDPQGRPTVADLVDDDVRVYPVGRLDTDSEGLIILTNDGDLTLRLTHPRFGVHKTYVALVEGEVGSATIAALTDGVELEDGPATAIQASVIDRSRGTSMVEVVMGDGRNRIVRRMLDAVGHPVRRLIRTAIGPLRDTTLQPGTARPLSLQEVRELYATGNADGG